MSNKVRGESLIQLGDISIEMNPSCEALCSVEDELNCGVVEIMDRYVKNRSRFKDTVAIIYHCQKQKKYSFEEVGEMVRKQGLVGPSVQAFTTLSFAFEQPKKKEETEKEMTTTQKLTG